jgi:hypothetical protein
VIFPDVNYELSLGLGNVKERAGGDPPALQKIGILVLVMHIAWSPNTGS